MEEEAVNPYATPRTSPQAEPRWILEFIPGAPWFYETLRTIVFFAMFRIPFELLLGPRMARSGWPGETVWIVALAFTPLWIVYHNRKIARKVKADPPLLRERQTRAGGPAWGPLEGKHRAGSLWLTDAEILFLPKDTRLGKLLVSPLHLVSRIRTRSWLGFRFPTTLLVEFSNGQQVHYTVCRPRRWKREMEKLVPAAAAVWAARKSEEGGPAATPSGE